MIDQSPYITNKNEVKSNKKVDFFIITTLILFIANVAQFVGNNGFAISVFLVLLFIFIIRKIKFDFYLIVLLVIWSIINELFIIVNGVEYFSLISFIGVTIRMLIPYFMVKIIGIDFFDKFYSYAYKLVIISLLIYALNVLFPSLFQSMASYLNFITKGEQKQAGGWYIFVYMYSAWGSPERNCGFMWEPGAFAFVVIFLLLFRFMKNNFKIDKQVIILLITLLTTFSTAGYLALFVIIVFYLLQIGKTKKNVLWLLPFLLMIFIYSGLRFYNSSEFMKNKIDLYIDLEKDTREWSFGEERMIRVSRLGIAMIEMEASLHWPLGNGVQKNKYILEKYGDVAGPNSLAEILSQWGWLGIIYLIYSFYCFVKIFYKDNLFVVCFILTMSIVMFSNPFLFKYLIYAIVFYTLQVMKESKRLRI